MEVGDEKMIGRVSKKKTEEKNKDTHRMHIYKERNERLREHTA